METPRGMWGPRGLYGRLGKWRPLGAVGEVEFQQPLGVHLVEQLELCGQLVGLLPLGGELGALLVVVVVGQLLARVGVPAERPEAIQVDLVAHGGGQRVHEDARAQPFGGQLLGLPVAGQEGERERGRSMSLLHLKPVKVHHNEV